MGDLYIVPEAALRELLEFWMKEKHQKEGTELKEAVELALDHYYFAEGDDDFH